MYKLIGEFEVPTSDDQDTDLPGLKDYLQGIADILSIPLSQLRRSSDDGCISDSDLIMHIFKIDKDLYGKNSPTVTMATNGEFIGQYHGGITFRGVRVLAATESEDNAVLAIYASVNDIEE